MGRFENKITVSKAKISDSSEEKKQMFRFNVKISGVYVLGYSTSTSSGI